MADTSTTITPREPTPGTVPARLLHAIRSAGRAGMCLDEFLGLDLGINRQQLNTRANRLVNEGLVFKAGKGKISTGRLRYFEAAADALAWEAAGAANPAVARPKADAPRPPTKHTAAMVEMMARRSKFNEREAAFRASNRSDIEPVMTERTRRFVAPVPPDHRYVATGAVKGGLKDQGIGRYLVPASGWAAAVVGGAL